MPKIYTLTLNPALDRSLYCEDIKFEYTNRTDKVFISDGGKGTHVSFALSKLKQNNTAISVLGGFAGSQVESIILRHGVNLMKFSVEYETRVCTSIFDKELDSIKVNEAGLKMSELDLQRLDSFLENLFGEDQIWVLAGSIPVGVPKDYYAQLITRIQSFTNSKVYLDTSGDALQLAIKAKPFFVKPNQEEMESLVGYPIHSIEAGKKSIAEIVSKFEIESVALSMGKYGIILCQDNQTIHVLPPDAKTVKTVGAGDGLLAGLIYGHIHNKSILETAAYGVSIGSLSTEFEEMNYPEIEQVQAKASEIINSQLIV